MATITIGLSGSAVVNGSRTYTIQDADVTRWINAYRAPAQQAKDAADGLGVPHSPVTNAQILAYWANEVIRRTKQHVKDAETAAPAEIGVIEN